MENSTIRSQIMSRYDGEKGISKTNSRPRFSDFSVPKIRKSSIPQPPKYFFNLPKSLFRLHLQNRCIIITSSSECYHGIITSSIFNKIIIKCCTEESFHKISHRTKIPWNYYFTYFLLLDCLDYSSDYVVLF